MLTDHLEPADETKKKKRQVPLFRPNLAAWGGNLGSGHVQVPSPAVSPQKGSAE